MPIVGLRQLSRETRAVVNQLDVDSPPVVITDHGRPVAALLALTEEQAAAYALAVAPDLIAGRERAERAIDAGQGKPSGQVLAELRSRESRRRGAVGDLSTTERTTADEMPAVDAFARSAESPAAMVLPSSLIEALVNIALSGATTSAASAPAVHRVNLELVDTLVRESLASVAKRVRAVNESIAAEVGGVNGDLALTSYVSELEQATIAERRAVLGCG